MNRAWLFPIIIAGVAVLIVAVIGMTIAEFGPWYHSLAKPRWAPADPAYSAAWTAVYSITALAGVTGWLAMPTWREREWLLGLLCLTGFLNILWSMLFFQFHRPDWALMVMLALWLSIVGLLLIVWRRSMVGAVLLLPYLLWVTFAGYLNQAIVHLNGPFA